MNEQILEFKGKYYKAVKAQKYNQCTGCDFSAPAGTDNKCYDTHIADKCGIVKGIIFKEIVGLDDQRTIEEVNQRVREIVKNKYVAIICPICNYAYASDKDRCPKCDTDLSIIKALCPTCLGEGELEETCNGDCRIGPNRICNGPDDGTCDEETGIITIVCPDCDGTGTMQETAKGNKLDVKMHRLSAPKIRKIKIAKTIKVER